jgi:hypothetical protein
MEIKEVTVYECRIVLNKREAMLLKGLVQNSPCDPIDESVELKELREKIFNSITI